MNWNENLLNFDVETSCNQLSQFIESKRIELKRDGVLIGLSGGLDSAVIAYLTVHRTQKDLITLLYLPDKDSKKRHYKDAELVANELCIPLRIQEITPILEIIGVYKLLPLHFIPGFKLKDILVKVGKKASTLFKKEVLSERLSPKPDSLISKGNAYGSIKHRIRMVMLYNYANIHNLLVVGAANKTELVTGSFSQWGCDQCADVMPIINFYRTQIETLAEHLKIPDQIRNKPADPDVIPGVDNKGDLLGTFQIADQILWGIENNISKGELVNRFGIEKVTLISTLYENSRFMREVPYTLG